MLLVRLAKDRSGPGVGRSVPYARKLRQRLVPMVNTSRAETLTSFGRFKGIDANTKARVVIQHSTEDSASMPAFPKYLD